jgi:hypothetical protein
MYYNSTRRGATKTEGLHLQIVHSIPIVYGRSVAENIQAADYNHRDCASLLIRHGKFLDYSQRPPKENGQIENFDLFLLRFIHNGPISDKQVLKAMEIEGLRPITLDEAFAIAEVHPELQTYHQIIALGSVCEGHFVPCLRTFNGKRIITVDSLDRHWDGLVSFGAVKA